MTTIRKVAEQAAVSIATVSRVVNGSTAVAPELRDRVMAAVNSCGYSPAVGRRVDASVALVYPGPFSVGSPYDAACLDGIVTAMLDTIYDLRILHLRRDKSPEETYSQYFFRKGIRGVILRSTAAERDVVRAIAEENFPAVVVGDHFDLPGMLFAYNASGAASVEGIEHLLSLGHRRIAFAGNEADDGDHLDRLHAYRETLQTAELYDEQLEFRVPAHRMDGAQLLRRMMAQSMPPTAVYIADPLISVGAINEARRIGLQVPKEFSILGFDDAETRDTLFPTMTAVCQDSRGLGRMAYESLLRRCDLPPKTPDSDDSPPLGKAWLEIHNSTGSAPERATRVLPNGERLAVARH